MGDVRDDEAVAVLMEDEAAADFVAGDSFVLREFIGGRLGGGRPGLKEGCWAGARRSTKRSRGEFLDESAFFELGEHLYRARRFDFLDLQGAGEVFERRLRCF